MCCIKDARLLSSHFVSSDRDLAAELAAEIRAAIAEVAPAPEPRRPAEPAPPEEESARDALRRSQAYVTPTIPPASRLSRGKRLALRALRFLWRDQAAFNTLLIEASESSLAALAGQRRMASAALADLRAELERRHGELKDAYGEIQKFESRWARRAAVQDGRLARLEPGAPAAVTSSSASPPSLPPGVYRLFEERFRGSPEDIASKQRSYLDFLRALPGPVLDVGCGLGEFLEMLRAEGIRSSGIDVNPLAVAECRGKGLEVEEGDGIAFLSARAARSLGGIVAFQVVEHWTPEATYGFLREAARALAPGGVLIAETINTDSLTAWRAFFLDPSHVRPYPPEALRFLAEAAGLADVRIEYRAELPAGDRLSEGSANDRKLNDVIFGPQDYAVIGYAPSGT